MENKIIKTIKTEKEIRVRGKVPVELLNLNEILQEVENAHTPNELVKASIYTKEVEEAVRIAKKKLNDAIKKELEIAKAVIDANSNLEKAIKDKFLQTISFTKTPKKERNGDLKTDENGEVMFTETSNLPKGVASYTPAKTKLVVDKEKLLDNQITRMVTDPKEHSYELPLLIKEVKNYIIDEEALAEYVLANGTKDLPMKEVKTEAKISLQGKFLLDKNNQKLLLAEKHEVKL